MLCVTYHSLSSRRLISGFVSDLNETGFKDCLNLELLRGWNHEGRVWCGARVSTPGSLAERLRLAPSAMALVIEDAQEQQLPQAGFGGLGVPVQAVAVVGSPAFPNSIKWSQDNLLAIASGHLVTILVRRATIYGSLVPHSS